MRRGPILAYDVFICHSNKDQAIANAACAVLERNDIRCWIAPRDVVPGTRWRHEVAKAIPNARIMLLVFSRHAKASWQVEREIDCALAKEIPLLPMRIEDVEPSPSLQFVIGEWHWLDAYPPPLEQHLNRLTDAVRQMLAPEPVMKKGASQQGPGTLRAARAVPMGRARLWQGQEKLIAGGVVLAVAITAGAVVLSPTQRPDEVTATGLPISAASEEGNLTPDNVPTYDFTVGPQGFDPGLLEEQPTPAPAIEPKPIVTESTASEPTATPPAERNSDAWWQTASDAELFGIGTEALENGHYREALILFAKLQRLRPAHTKGVEVYSGICVAGAALGYSQQYLSTCDWAANQSPPRSSALTARAYAYFKMGDYSRSVSELDRSLRLNRDSAALYMRGVARLKSGKLRAGKADVSAATKLDAQAPALAAKLGIVP
jgi:hypothetical protein